MKASILTLRELKFLRLRIDIDFDVETKASEFDFDGAQLGWDINHGRNNDTSNAWWVAIGFANSNEGAETKCPYLLDIQAIGYIEINESVPEEKRERIIYENGAALVYGAIREMTLTVTGRFLPGALMLPTPTFIDSFAERDKPQEETAPSGK